jgi:hypothetical protein
MAEVGEWVWGVSWPQGGRGASLGWEEAESQVCVLNR